MARRRRRTPPAPTALAGYLSLLAADGHPVERIRTYPAHTALAARRHRRRPRPGVRRPRRRPCPAHLRRARRPSRSSAAGRVVASGCGRCCSPHPSGRRRASPTRICSCRRRARAGSRELRSAGDGLLAARRRRAAGIRHRARRSLVAVASLGLGRVILLADASAAPGRLPRHRRQRTVRARRRRGAVAAGRVLRELPRVRACDRLRQHPAALGRAARRPCARRARADDRARPPARPAGSRRAANCRRRDARTSTRSPGSWRGRSGPTRRSSRFAPRRRARLARRVGPRRGCAAGALEAAARRVGLPDAEIDAMLGRPGSGDPVLAAGRALVHAGRTDVRRDE